MEFVAAFANVLVAVLGLGAGLILSGRPLEGSCGGLACVVDGSCEGCPRKTSETRGESGS